MSDIHRRVGDFGEAAAICDQGIEHHPDQPLFLAIRRYAQAGDKGCRTIDEALRAA